MDLFLTWVVVTVNLFYCWHLPLGDDHEVMCESEQLPTERYRHPMFRLRELGLRPRGMEDFARATWARSYLTMEQELRDEDRPEWSSREMLERAEFLVRYWQFLTADLRKLSVEYDSDSSRLSKEQS